MRQFDRRGILVGDGSGRRATRIQKGQIARLDNVANCSQKLAPLPGRAGEQETYPRRGFYLRPVPVSRTASPATGSRPSVPGF